MTYAGVAERAQGPAPEAEEAEIPPCCYFRRG